VTGITNPVLLPSGRLVELPDRKKFRARIARLRDRANPFALHWAAACLAGRAHLAELRLIDPRLADELAFPRFAARYLPLALAGATVDEITERALDDLDEGLPDGWPWPPPDPGAEIDMPDRSRPWDGPNDAGRRTAERRRLRVVQHEIGERALGALIAAVPGLPRTRRTRTLTASVRPYRGGLGSFKVNVRDRTVVDRRGRPVSDVRVLENGTLIAAAPPARIAMEVEPRPSGDTNLDRIAAFGRGVIDRMALVAEKEAAIEHERGAVARLVQTVESLLKRPQPPISVQPPAVTVKAPDKELRELKGAVERLANRPVHVDAHVTVEAPKPRAVKVEYDDDGRKLFVPVEDDDPEGRT
jgi:hypothetical protein